MGRAGSNYTTSALYTCSPENNEGGVECVVGAALKVVREVVGAGHQARKAHVGDNLLEPGSDVVGVGVAYGRLLQRVLELEETVALGPDGHCDAHDLKTGYSIDKISMTCQRNN